MPLSPFMGDPCGQLWAQTVSKWRARFVAHRLDGLGDAPRPGRVRTVTDEQVAELVRLTLETKPRNATHRSTRSMARRAGMSQSTVSRIWRAFGLEPHRSESFKLSTDLLFVDKVHDVVGLYLDPPERALVLCVDEKSQIQALDRSQPVLPMMPGVPGVPERRSHDYLRAGTTTLFAALDAANGKVIGSLHRRHRTAEFKKFPAELDREVPAGLDVHLIVDNYGTHKTEPVRRWLLSHPRFHPHFTRQSVCWSPVPVVQLNWIAPRPSQTALYVLRPYQLDVGRLVTIRQLPAPEVVPLD
ncbi:hypothetical protein GCM10010339_58960 [Streptomyces alanosinicus]|uniref:IS630 family transposase n=1 Tax=Streptomyces alanosinicus TaxID=68171 RepID=A0A918YN48_9ACTN|nr:hypothetical protein GCM10010339_58960 [Streptomyces alanosinicus]